MIYLNASAGTKVYPEVIETITDVLQNHCGNPHDSTSFGHDAMMIIDEVTQFVADDLNCNLDEVIWTSGACEANSLAIMGVLGMNPHMHFYTTHLEHASINEILQSSPGNPIGFLTNDNQGYIDMDNLENALCWNYTRNIKTLVSISFANSEIGVIQNIKAIADIVHKYDGILHTDATQIYPWMNIDVQKLGIDMMSVSGQKLHAPKGIGFLYVKDGIKLKPLIYGSQQLKRRGGTLSTHLIAAFGKALVLTRVRTSCIHTIKLRNQLLDDLLKIDGVHVNGPREQDLLRLPNVVSLTIDGVNAEKLVTMCDLMGVIIGKGSACQSHEPKPSEALLAVGLTEEQALNTVRISLDESNTEEEIKEAAAIITKLIERIRQNE
jgi:cysteine desulfurase